ncbi:migration and invasion-inhibitory protein isoform X2 [Pleurodeles waltl]|uniref:migration and invasion-inhibitory protein isoform X2 n=1 Tax=Pleurodeles waltl TaxID=8319 RepID=UPI003709B48E
MMLVTKDMESLRRTNKALVECLKGKQAEFRDLVPLQSVKPGSQLPSSLSRNSGPSMPVPTSRSQINHQISYLPVSENVKNQQTLSMEVEQTSLVKLVPHGETAVARAALCSPRKMQKDSCSYICKDRSGDFVVSQQRVPEQHKICKYQALAEECMPPERQAIPVSRVQRGSREMDVPIENTASVALGLKSTTQKCPSAGAVVERLHPDPMHYADRLLDEGNNRQKEQAIKEMHKPKSILNMSRSLDAKKGAGRVMFQSNFEPSPLRPGPWTDRPLLGYDWIAGLLETDFSVAEKSEQYFSELNEFRRVNQEECIHARYLDQQALDISSEDEDREMSLEPHKCVYCYRVNQRLFPVPLDPAAACPVCKSRRPKQSDNIEEPAYVRVSIPRSTLLPPHKYKIHRRRSFDPSDSLALPSDLVSRVSGSSKSDHLLNLSRSAYFQLSRTARSGLIPMLDSSMA